MARAQTYIITKDQVYGYSSDLHNHNHHEHWKTFYQNLKITGYIPFLLSDNGECVLDLVAHGNSGTIYLPPTLVDYQMNWLMEKKDYLSKFTWNVSNMQNEKRNIYDDVAYDEVIKIMNLKKRL